MSSDEVQSAADSKPSDAPPQWISALVTMTAVQAATAFLTRIPPTLAPAFTVERGWSDAIIGYLASLGTLGSIIFLTLGAPMLHRLGSVRALQCGLCLGVIGLLLLLPPFWPAAAAASLLIGLGYGPSSPAGNDVLHRTAPARHRAMIFSIKQAGVPAGGIVAGLVLPPVVEAFGWRASLLVSSILVMLVLLAVQPMRERLDAGRTRDQAVTVRAFLSPANIRAPLAALTSSASIVRLAMAGACLALGQGIWFAYLMTFSVSAMGHDLRAAGIAFAIMQASSVVGRMLLGWLADRLGSPRQLLGLMGLASGLTSLAMAFAGPEWSYGLFCVLAAVAGVTVSSWNGVQLSEVARACPAHLVREASAGATLIIFLGYVVGPSVFAVLLMLTHRFDIGFLLCALFGVICFAIMPRRASSMPGGHG
jgi:MFS family permease